MFGQSQCQNASPVAFSARAVCWIWLILVGCDRAPPEPEAPSPYDTEAVADGPEPEPASEGESSEDAAEPPPAPSCLVELPADPPPRAESLSSCPKDPTGRPNMPRAALRFDEAETAPVLRVELALSPAHQMHGLMFRSTLTDEEGMLFSYPEAGERNFWMRNTCLALDMIFADEDQVVVGVVEQVTPWNDQVRSVPCPAAHVLEVPAGWVRRYDVEPGMRFRLEGL